MKNRIVRFTDGKARVHIADDISAIVADENTFINPDLSAVKDISPELWAVVDNKIVPVENQEQRLKEIHAEAETIINKIPVLTAEPGVVIRLEEEIHILKRNMTVMMVVSIISLIAGIVMVVIK